MTKKIILSILGLLIAYMLFTVFSSSKGSEGASSFNKLGVSIIAGLYLGFLFVSYILPIIAHKTSQLVMSDSDVEPEQDSMHDARSLVAQGAYDEAIVAYRKVVDKEPENRMAWTAMAKVYAENLEQHSLAIATYREAYDNHEWEEEDASFFLFRISEWQADPLGDQAASIASLQEVITAYPSTRSSANAIQLLRKQGIEPS